MRFVRLIATSDEYDRDPGLALVGVPRGDGFMADREGTLIAHDLLEHVNGPANIGTVWDELEALGAIWHVRGRHGDLRNSTFHSPAVNVAADVTRMFPEWLAEGWGPRLPRTRAGAYEEDFREVLAHARADIAREYDDANPADIRRYLDEALIRMRIGFSKANRRFGSGYRGFDTFCRVQEAVASVARHVEFEGQQFRLGYSRYEATCEEVYAG